MPIPVNPVLQAPTPPTRPVPPRTAPGASRGAGFRIEFTRGSSSLVLAASVFDGWRALVGAQGLDLPPVRLFADPLPDGRGDLYRASRYGSREVFLPLSVAGEDYQATRDKVRHLWEIVGDLGEFDLTVVQPEGDRRTVTARYVSGLEGSYTDSDWWVNRRHLGLTVVAHDPMWYGANLIQQWQVDVSSTRPFLHATDPFFPVVLGDSLVAGEETVRNPGELDAYPVITVTGPGTDLVVENTTSGESFELTGAILAGEWVTFDARPGVLDVFDAAGDVWDRVTLGSVLWSLAPGDNGVRVTMQNATAASGVELSFRPPYRTAH